MDKSGDCRDWSVLDCLKEIVRQIESGEINPNMVIVCMAGESEPHCREHWQAFAGLMHLDAVGMLYKHLRMAEEIGRDD